MGFDETYLEKVECNIEDLIFLAEIKDYVVDNARFYMLYKSYLTEKRLQDGLRYSKRRTAASKWIFGTNR